MFTVDSRKVGVSGDWHGETGWALQVLKSFHREGVYNVFHLGDFGFWGGTQGASYVRKISNLLVQKNMNLFVTPGNHENYTKILSRTKDTDGLYVYADRVKVFPKGFHGEISGVDFVSLGGANSIDFDGRVEGESWWEEERISVFDYTNAVSQGKKTLMFCHDAPYGMPINSDRKTVKSGWSDSEVEYSNMSRKVLRETINITQPDVLFHGHYHVFQDVETVFTTVLNEKFTVRSIGLNMEYSPDNSIVFDVKNFSYTMLNV